VPGLGEGDVGVGVVLLPPPQPINIVIAKKSVNDFTMRLRGLIKNRAPIGSHDAKNNIFPRKFCAVVGAVVLTETFTAAGLAPGVTLAGLTEHVLNMGTPVHDNATVLLNDPTAGETLSM
jgi:hypothetical protein